MNNNLNINGQAVNKIVTVLQFVLLQYYEKGTNNLISTMRQLAGEDIVYPQDKTYDEDLFWKFEYLRNFSSTIDGSTLMPKQVPSSGASYYVDLIAVEVPKAYAEIVLMSASQISQTTIDIMSDIDLYFRVENLNTISFEINCTKTLFEDRKKYICSFEIYGLTKNPGQTNIFSPTLTFYTDSNCSNKLGECSVNIKVYHETSGNPD